MTRKITYQQIETLKKHFKALLAMPWASETLSGRMVEEIVSATYGGRVLPNYDYVDVLGETGDRKAWQVKATKSSTPITWKRAKIPNKTKLINASHSDHVGLQRLGDAIITFCNNNITASIKKYKLEEIIYARAIFFVNGDVRYFERVLATANIEKIFEPSDYYWRWSKQKQNTKKEQLPALHGFRRSDDKKIWAWHGNGENQLHFSAENEWWQDGQNFLDIKFKRPPQIDYESFVEMTNNYLRGLSE